ncbi:hypothetical protein DFH06DRAFT_1142621 [Mycena polygramma]|nr:hypothetical protein DFH06DRAFT_1142621 [Mycena polygramma]
MSVDGQIDLRKYVLTRTSPLCMAIEDREDSAASLTNESLLFEDWDVDIRHPFLVPDSAANELPGLEPFPSIHRFRRLIIILIIIIIPFPPLAQTRASAGNRASAVSRASVAKEITIAPLPLMRDKPCKASGKVPAAFTGLAPGEKRTRFLCPMPPPRYNSPDFVSLNSLLPRQELFADVSFSFTFPTFKFDGILGKADWANEWLWPAGIDTPAASFNQIGATTLHNRRALPPRGRIQFQRHQLSQIRPKGHIEQRAPDRGTKFTSNPTTSSYPHRRPTVPPLMRLLSRTLSSVTERAGIPARPGEVPGYSATFSLEVQILGKHDRQVVISFDVVTVGWYDIYQDSEIEEHYRDLLERIGPELSHNSETWACLECDLPATDIGWFSMYHTTQQPYKRCTIMISPGCKKCARRMRKWTPKIIQKANADRPGPSSILWDTIPRPNGMSEGLSGACLTCRKAETAASEFPMSRCAKCKLVRATHPTKGAVVAPGTRSCCIQRDKSNQCTKRLSTDKECTKDSQRKDKGHPPNPGSLGIGGRLRSQHRIMICDQFAYRLSLEDHRNLESMPCKSTLRQMQLPDRHLRPFVRTAHCEVTSTVKRMQTTFMHGCYDSTPRWVPRYLLPVQWADLVSAYNYSRVGKTQTDLESSVAPFLDAFCIAIFLGEGKNECCTQRLSNLAVRFQFPGVLGMAHKGFHRAVASSELVAAGRDTKPTESAVNAAFGRHRTMTSVGGSLPDFGSAKGGTLAFARYANLVVRTQASSNRLLIVLPAGSPKPFDAYWKRWTQTHKACWILNGANLAITSAYLCRALCAM